LLPFDTLLGSHLDPEVSLSLKPQTVRLLLTGNTQSDPQNREQLFAAIRAGSGPEFLPFSRRPIEISAEGHKVSLFATPEPEAIEACNFGLVSELPLRWTIDIQGLVTRKMYSRATH